MNKISYSGYRFPPEIIQQAIWLYLRFTLSLRDVEVLLAERGVAVSYETVRPSLIYRRTKNLRAVQLLLGHTKLESTVRYLGIEVEDALELAEQTEV